MTRLATKQLMGRTHHMIHILRMIHILGATELGGVGFHHATQNKVQFRICELFLEFST